MGPLLQRLATVYSQFRDHLEKVITIPAMVLSSLRWWTNLGKVLEGVSFISPPHSVKLVSDASDLAFGMHVSILQTQSM